jgi:hypothetical protein
LGTDDQQSVIERHFKVVVYLRLFRFPMRKKNKHEPGGRDKRTDNGKEWASERERERERKRERERERERESESEKNEGGAREVGGR